MNCWFRLLYQTALGIAGDAASKKENSEKKTESD